MATDINILKNRTRQSRMESIEANCLTGLKGLNTRLGEVDFHFCCSLKLCSATILNWSVGETL
jgi:hypothetical protein